MPRQEFHLSSRTRNHPTPLAGSFSFCRVTGYRAERSFSSSYHSFCEASSSVSLAGRQLVTIEIEPFASDTTPLAIGYSPRFSRIHRPYANGRRGGKRYEARKRVCHRANTFQHGARGVPRPRFGTTARRCPSNVGASRPWSVSVA